MSQNDTYLCHNHDCGMFDSCKRQLVLKEESSDAENGEQRFFAYCLETGYTIPNLTHNDTLKGRHDKSKTEPAAQEIRVVRYTKQIGRFDVSAKVRDIKLRDPMHRYAAILPYEQLDRLKKAHKIIKLLLKEYDKAGSEGWVHSVAGEDWGSQFPRKYEAIYRFKDEQIEVGSKANGHVGEWRIRTDTDFDAHYQKRKSVNF